MHVLATCIENGEFMRLRALLADARAHDLVTFEDEKKAPAGFAQLARAW